MPYEASTVSFESSVVLDGTKTIVLAKVVYQSFESSVVLDGTKTTMSIYPIGI